jgi:hypothetical protein
VPLIGFGQQTYVPDDNFENYLEANGMGNGTPNDNYVLTSNINTVMGLAVDNLNISDLTGIEDFSALTELFCENNQLTTLDVSGATSLEGLECPNNQLTSLDVSGATALTELFCDNNQLTTLDVGNNTALTNLDCHTNNLTTLDVSSATALRRLDCENNQLTCLDVSNNTDLDELVCGDNFLNQLSLQNGNYLDFEIEAQSNNLICVEVDNVGYANVNWIDVFDNGVVFNTNCNYTNPCATVSTIEEHTTNKELLKITDILGRETEEERNTPLFYIYNDGTVEKRIVIE